MAAQVITREEVFVVADQIASTGKDPSAKSIYDILQKGGMSTINKYLKEWRQLRAEPILKMPEQLNRTSMQLVNQLWRIFCDEYSAELEAIRAANDLKIQEITSERDEAFLAVDEERLKFLESEKGRKYEKTQRQDLETQYAKLQAESDCKVTNLKKQLLSAQECIKGKQLESANLRELNMVQDNELVHANMRYKELKSEFETQKMLLQKRETELECLRLEKTESESSLQKKIDDLIYESKRVEVKLQKMKYSRSAKNLSQPKTKKDTRSQKRRANTVL